MFGLEDRDLNTWTEHCINLSIFGEAVLGNLVCQVVGGTIKGSQSWLQDIVIV